MSAARGAGDSVLEPGADESVALEDALARYGSEQVVVVACLRADPTRGVLDAFERGPRGWTRVAGPTRVFLGRNGAARDKSEGDGRTPLGTFGLGEAFGFGDDPGTALPYRRLSGDEVWVDDPGSRAYNTLQRAGEARDWRSAERLSAARDAYEWAIVVDYNRAPAVPGRGSAVFVHVDVGRPTTGCVAVERATLRELLRWLRPEATPAIAITD